MSEKEGVTREDAQNVLNYNLAFGVDLPDEDIVFLYRTFINYQDGELLDEPTKQNLKRLICEMVLTDQGGFDDVLFAGVRSSAEEILAQGIAEIASKGVDLGE